MLYSIFIRMIHTHTHTHNNRNVNIQYQYILVTHSWNSTKIYLIVIKKYNISALILLLKYY